jgi:hypothetical protein
MTPKEKAARRAEQYRADRVARIKRQQQYYEREKVRILAHCKARYKARKEGAK